MGQTELPLYGDLRSLLLVRKRFEKSCTRPRNSLEIHRQLLKVCWRSSEERLEGKEMYW
jgi:hypothetical protein